MRIVQENRLTIKATHSVVVAIELKSRDPLNKTATSFDFYRPHPKDGGRLCFHFVHHLGGGGYPISGLGGGYPIPGLGRGYPIPGPGGGYPIPGQGRGGGTLSQVWMGYPPKTWDGVPPWTWDRVPPQTWDGVPPRTRSGLDRAARGGRCASCVHAGGLPCLFLSIF